MAQMESEAGKGGGERPRCVPDLRQNLEELAEVVRAWGDSLGVEAGYYDPRIEEGGSNDWGGALRRATKDALKVAMSLLVVRGGADLANDLGGRFDRLYELADAYQEALEALED